MNREIKFRAWEDKTKTMMPNVKILLIEENAAYAHRRRWMHNCMDWEEEDLINDPILMQFTGLLDKTGAEIFEGDIVRGNHVDLFIIEGINGGLQMYNSNYYGQKHNELISEATCDAQTASWLKNSTVIGNIYQNPELLESVQK